MPNNLGRLELEYQRAMRLVRKLELSVAKKQEQLEINEQKVHTWILQKSEKREYKSLLRVNHERWQYKTFMHENHWFSYAQQFIGNSIADIEIWLYLPAEPVLHNLFINRQKLKEALLGTKLELKNARNIEYELKRKTASEFEKLRKPEQHNAGYGNRGLNAPKMDIENWNDAETFAVKYMRWLGFSDAQKTGSGSDEGKDVNSSKAVAQVKDMGTGVGRPMLQQLFGVAAAEKKIPVFFARSYAKTAKEWGEKHGMVLFQFSIRGEVKAVSTKAEQMLKKKSS